MPSRPSESGTQKTVKWYDDLEKWQKVILFVVGVGLIAWGAFDVDPEHWGEHGLGLATAEIGLAALRIVAGFLVGLPPLGMWLVRKAPLPKFLKRDNST
jgi:hypothetical protein